MSQYQLGLTWKSTDKKTCPNCGITKTGFQKVAEFFGYRTYKGSLYLNSWCKRCTKDLNRVVRSRKRNLSNLISWMEFEN